MTEQVTGRVMESSAGREKCFQRDFSVTNDTHHPTSFSPDSQIRDLEGKCTTLLSKCLLEGFQKEILNGFVKIGWVLVLFSKASFPQRRHVQQR